MKRKVRRGLEKNVTIRIRGREKRNNRNDDETEKNGDKG